MWNDEAREKILLQKRGHLLEEFELGIWTKDKYMEKLEDLEGGAPWVAAKHQKVCCVSPDWPETFNKD